FNIYLKSTDSISISGHERVIFHCLVDNKKFEAPRTWSYIQGIGGMERFTPSYLGSATFPFLLDLRCYSDSAINYEVPLYHGYCDSIGFFLGVKKQIF